MSKITYFNDSYPCLQNIILVVPYEDLIYDFSFNVSNIVATDLDRQMLLGIMAYISLLQPADSTIFGTQKCFPMFSLLY